MKSSAPLRILEEHPNKRGDLFGRLIGDLFLALGYDNVRLNIHKSGREIDLHATHRTEPRCVIAECKATKTPIGGDDVNKFVGALDAERKLKANKNIDVTGYFISLSGYTESAVEQEEQAGQRLILLDGNQVVKELIHGRIISPIEKVMERAGRCAATRFNNIPLETTYELLAHEIGWIWAVFFLQNKQTTSFALIHADGDALSSDLAEIIIQADNDANGKLKSLAYLPPLSQPAAIENLIPEAISQYFQYLLSECGEIQLEGLPADQEVGIRRLDLENIFVPLFVEPIPASKKDNIHSAEANVHKRRLVGEALEENSRLAILAPPGGGKSTLLKRLAISYALPERRTLIDDHLPDRSWFPLFFRCRHLGELAKFSIKETLFAIPKRAELTDELANAFSLVVNQTLRNGEALLLIDGLDEISDEGTRITYINQLRTFLATYPNVSLVLTSREVGFRVVGGTLSSHCRQYKLADFDDQDIKRLTLAWHREVVGDKTEILMEAKKLAQVICKTDRVRTLAKNPLLLTTLLLVKRWVGQLPNRRSVLYGKAIEVLLMTWNVEAHQPIEQDEAVPQLAFVAFSMMRNGKQEISIKRLKEELALARKQMPEVLAYAKTSINEFINRIEFRSSILIMSGHRIEDATIYPMYEFRHLTFQEYLAARAIVEGYYPDRQDTDTLLSVIQPYLLEPAWKEVIPLVAVLAGRKVQPLIKHLVNTILEAYHSTRYANQLLAQCIVDEIQITPDLLNESLLCLIEQSGPDELLMLPIFRGKFGNVLYQLVQQKHMESSENWRNTGELFALLTLDSLNWVSGKEIPKELARKIEFMLEQDDAIQNIKGLLIVMKIAKDIKTPQAWLIKTPKVFESLVGKITPHLLSGDPHIHFAASWALGWLKLLRVWTSDSYPEVLSRLVNIRAHSPSEEAKNIASWALSVVGADR